METGSPLNEQEDLDAIESEAGIKDSEETSTDKLETSTSLNDVESKVV